MITRKFQAPRRGKKEGENTIPTSMAFTAPEALQQASLFKCIFAEKYAKNCS